MNPQKKLALLFAVASLLASCSNDFDLGAIFSGSVIVILLLIKIIQEM